MNGRSARKFNHTSPLEAVLELLYVLDQWRGVIKNKRNIASLT